MIGEPTVRIVFERIISIQGPQSWALKTAQRQIQGTIEVGPGRFVTAETALCYQGRPIDGLTPDPQAGGERESFESFELRQARENPRHLRIGKERA